MVMEDIMNDLFAEILKLKGFAEKVFYGDVFGDDDIYEREFLILLKELTETDLEEFYQAYPPHYKQYFAEQLKKLAAYDKEEIINAQKIITNILADNPAGVEKMKIKREKDQLRIREYRELLKAGSEYSISDQDLKVPPPPMQKPYPPTATLIELPTDYQEVLQNSSILDCIKNRKSRRNFTETSLTLTELTWLLWSTQGVHRVIRDTASLRTVPSGGARHPFETYLVINHVESLKPGIYRYLPYDHKLLFIKEEADLKSKMIENGHGQKFVGNCAVCFIWTGIPYRMEWRYTLQAKKDILIEAGHVCQNLYLACEAINAGTCGIAAYDQTKTDSLIQVDGIDEMTVYLSPVGKYNK
jgi:SagB-type dehydrogenase family enzyme